MNKKLLFFMALTLPLFVFLNVLQAYEYEKRSRNIRQMEAVQGDWIEKNKQVINGISVLSSPDRIARLAEEELGLQLVPTEDVIKVDVPPVGGTP